ncbi:MAG: nicotinate-nucleotide adenylyltransferase [Thermodesulfobacteriota bacterium]
MHIVIMGGTFDPIHYGHLRGAEEVRETIKADKVLFIPAAVSPNKTEDEAAPAEDRLEMVRLATKDNPKFEVSDMEIKRGGKSYTIDTLKELQKEHPEGTLLTLVIGSDSYNDIMTWHEYASIFSYASIVILPRPRHVPKKIEKFLPVELAQEFWYDEGKSAYKHNDSGNVVFCLDSTTLDISSTAVRALNGVNASIKYMVPPEVEEYIRTKGLYKKK